MVDQVVESRKELKPDSKPELTGVGTQAMLDSALDNDLPGGVNDPSRPAENNAETRAMG